jgi:chemotaxis response regulator CheB
VYKLIAVGISTGGPVTLRNILTQIEEIKIPIVIIQHMPKDFSVSMAEGLNSISKVPVVHCYDGIKLEKKVYIAAAGEHLVIDENDKEILRFADKSEYPDNKYFVPSADVFFKSAAINYKDELIAVVMTGLPAFKDGTKGSREVKKNGGITVTQSALTCIAHGMPARSLKEGNIDCIADVEDIKVLFSDYEKFFKLMKNKKTKKNSEINILVVDDNYAHRVMIKEFLQTKSYSVDLAENGIEAFEKAVKKKYEVIIMDIQMPVMDGLESIKAIYNADPMQKIIVLTASISDETKKKAVSLEVFDFINKPADMKRILDSVDKAVKAYYL